ncbi:50S ribosomal protein L32 [Candidatus Uhrbacteria bacterium]|nr:50S ribosomal protein L32 [Candidatus Uhrbacteria bacterium]
MPVPARKLSRSKGRRRRSHDHMNPVQVGTCEKCRASTMAHHACPTCGFYKGRQVVDHSRKVARLLKKTGHAHPHDEQTKKA